ncbi:MAG: hypothetical protein CNLJKLNK_01379 [Holosporales bacterium]
MHSFKRIVLNIALTTSAFSNPLQTNESTPQQSMTMPRLRRRFADFEDVEIIHAAHVAKSVYFWNDYRQKYKVLGAHDDKQYDTFFAITEHTDGKIYIGFRGTDNIKNVIIDLWCNWAHSHKTGEFYHNGILKAYEGLHLHLKNVLTSIANERVLPIKQLLDENVLFTGHSLGGGMALLAADFFLNAYGAKTRTICFATPMVMDAVSAKKITHHFSNRILNIQQDYDPIPHIMDFGTHACGHAGHIMKIPHSGGFTNFKNVHRIDNYLQVLLNMQAIMEESSSYFNPQPQLIKEDALTHCHVRRFAHKHFISIKAYLPTLGELAMRYVRYPTPVEQHFK